MLTRRNLISVSTLAAGVGLSPAWSAEAASTPPRITTWIGGAEVPRRTVLEWEARRIQVAAERLSQHLVGSLLSEIDALVRRPALSTATVARDRQLLADVKLRMGEDRIRQIMARDLALSSPAGVLAALPERWTVSSAKVACSRGTARGFAEWFQERGRIGDERTMLVACPDHYLIRDLRTGVQEVIEITGGAMMAARFVIDYSDTAGVPIAKDSRYPVRLAGWAHSGSHRIGAVGHQFRNRAEGGFQANLAVAFPATLPPWMVAEHRWHLACEFSNWMSAYAATGR